MTEQDWLSSDKPGDMLDFLRGKASDRKLRLFACACTRRAWSPRLDWTFVDVAERLADKSALAEEIERATSLASTTAKPGNRHDRTEFAIGSLFNESASAAAKAWCDSPCYGDEHVKLFRDIFGNPFRPITIDCDWLAWKDGTVPKLAQAIYEERDFGGLAILADALEEAGCTNEDLLAHCRGHGPHVRGCWVVDLLLNKT